jgi:hypothetical protein
LAASTALALRSPTHRTRPVALRNLPSKRVDGVESATVVVEIEMNLAAEASAALKVIELPDL